MSDDARRLIASVRAMRESERAGLWLSAGLHQGVAMACAARLIGSGLFGSKEEAQ